MTSTSYLSAEQTSELVLQLNGTRGRLTPEVARELDSILRDISTNYPADIQYELSEKLIRSSEGPVRIFGSILLENVARRPGAARLKDVCLGHIERAVCHGCSQLEIRKLCDATATLFCSLEDWPTCFTDFLARYSQVTPLNLGKQQDLAFIRAALVLIDALTEQTGRLYARQNKTDTIESTFLQMVPPVLQFLFSTIHIEQEIRQIESPLAVLTKIFEHPMVAQSISTFETDLMSMFDHSVQLVIVGTLHNSQTFATLLDAVLNNNKLKISTPTWEQLVDFVASTMNGPLATISSFRQGNLGDDMQLVAAQATVLSIAFHSLNNESIFQYVDDPRWQNILQALLTEFRHEATDDESQLSIQILGFWNELIDSAIILGAEIPELPKFKIIEAYILEVIYHAVSTLRVSEAHTAEISSTATIDDDVVQLLKASYSFFQQSFIQMEPPTTNSQYDPAAKRPSLLLSVIMDNATASARDLSLTRRIGAFIAVADFAERNEANDSLISTILAAMSQLGTDQMATESHFVATFMGSYALYFTRHPDAIQSGLDQLFHMLRESNQACIFAAAQAITKLCHECRTSVAPHADLIIAEHAVLRNPLWQFVDAKQVLFKAVATAAFAADRAGNTRTNIQKAIGFLQADVVDLSTAAMPGTRSNGDGENHNIVLRNALTTLKSIQELGLAMSQGSDPASAINLDDEPADTEHSFLYEDLQMQQQLTSCISQILGLKSLSESEEALRLICEIFLVRSNYAVPMIFDFPPSLHLEILRVCIEKQLASDFAMSTFSLMLRSKRTSSDASIEQVFEDSLKLVMQYMYIQATQSGDPDVLTSALDLLQTYIIKAPALIDKYINDFSALLTLLTGLMVVPESLPKAAVCQLWVAILDDSYALVSKLSEQHLQSLVWNLCSQIVGGALQRDLEILSALTGKLVVKGPNVRRTFEEVFKVMGGQGTNVTGWQRFVGQIYMLRGKKSETKNVVSRFWEQCKTGSEQGTQDDDSDEGVIILDDL